MDKSSFLNRIFKVENFSQEELALISLQFEEIAFNKNDALIEKGVIPKEAQLSLRVFDVDHNAQFDGNLSSIHEEIIGRLT